MRWVFGGLTHVPEPLGRSRLPWGFGVAHRGDVEVNPGAILLRHALVALLHNSGVTICVSNAFVVTAVVD